MKIAILGLGGVGATAAAGLWKHQDELIFIARGETKKALQENGLIFDSELLGKRIVRPALVSDNPEEIGIVDILILATKSYGMPSACETYKSIIGENTLVVPLLNGVMGKRSVTETLGGHGVVAHGYIYCFSNIVTPGHVKNTNAILKIGVGFDGNEQNEKALLLCEMLEDGGIPTNYNQDILTALWEKYIMVTGNGCAFIHFDCTAGEIQKDPNKLAFLAAIYDDFVRLAIAHGAEIAEDLQENYLEKFLAFSPDSISSLYRDLKEGKSETEFEWLIGSACRLSKESNTPIPYIQQVYDEHK